jgi:GNAT superfamily N-acetyltransferase
MIDKIAYLTVVSNAVDNFYLSTIGRENRFLSQFILKIAMEINVRDWSRDDLPLIQRAWLEYFRHVARSDMHLRSDAEAAMKRWLGARYRQVNSLGLVAELSESLAGFLIGRIDDWESVPPVIDTRRIGIIDAVYVAERYRRQGIGRQLIDKAIAAMRVANAVAVETTYDAWNDASAQSWHRAGFAPWMVHAYRML